MDQLQLHLIDFILVISNCMAGKGDLFGLQILPGPFSTVSSMHLPFMSIRKPRKVRLGKTDASLSCANCICFW
jgi:hypothetical protein